MFMLNNGGAQAIATAPDICKVPSPAGTVPTPFPNIAMSNSANPIVQNVLVTGMPALNIGSTIMISNGDEAGVAGGAASSMIMGAAKFTIGSTKVMVGGQPAVKSTAMTTQNQNNTIGQASVPPPGQTKVMVMG